MDHVSKTRCHEKEIHCVNGGLGHMGMEEKDMAMQRRTNQTWETMCMCAWKPCMKTIQCGQGIHHVKEGLAHKMQEGKSS